jgi:hypothetical protein
VAAITVEELHPTPLAFATVTTTSGETVHGPLIVTTSEGCFLALHDPGGFRMVPSARIRDAQTRSRKAPEEDSVADLAEREISERWPW